MMLAIQPTVPTAASSCRTLRLVGDLLDVVHQLVHLFQGMAGQQADQAGSGAVGAETQRGLLRLERHRARLGALHLGLGDGGDGAAGIGALGFEAGAHPGTASCRSARTSASPQWGQFAARVALLFPMDLPETLCSARSR